MNVLLFLAIGCSMALVLDAGGEETRTALPPPQSDGAVSVERALTGRRSVRRFKAEELTLAQLSQLLWAAQGISEPRRGLRTAPSAGATYPLETLLVTPRGVYRYDPAAHAIDRLRAGDVRPQVARAALDQSCVRDAAALIVFSALEARTTGRYGSRGRMYVHMEAGHAAQNVHLQAVALGLGSVPVGAFDPEKLPEALGLEPRPGEQFLYLIPVGLPAD